ASARRSGSCAPEGAPEAMIGMLTAARAATVRGARTSVRRGTWGTLRQAPGPARLDTWGGRGRTATRRDTRAHGGCHPRHGAPLRLPPRGCGERSRGADGAVRDAGRGGLGAAAGGGGRGAAAGWVALCREPRVVDPRDAPPRWRRGGPRATRVGRM